MKPILSVCIITKNEKENLKKCITALKKDLFEIIVVDTICRRKNERKKRDVILNF